MDLKSEGSLADEDFGTGVTFASFHSAGVWPLTIQSLKNLVMLGKITATTVLRRWADTPSGPVAFHVFSLSRASNTSSSSMGWNCKTVFVWCTAGWPKSRAGEVLGGAKWEFNWLAISFGDWMVTEPVSSWIFLMLALCSRAAFNSFQTLFGCLEYSLHIVAK